MADECGELKVDIGQLLLFHRFLTLSLARFYLLLYLIHTTNFNFFDHGFPKRDIDKMQRSCIIQVDYSCIIQLDCPSQTLAEDGLFCASRSGWVRIMDRLVRSLRGWRLEILCLLGLNMRS